MAPLAPAGGGVESEPDSDCCARYVGLSVARRLDSLACGLIIPSPFTLPRLRVPSCAVFPPTSPNGKASPSASASARAQVQCKPPLGRDSLAPVACPSGRRRRRRGENSALDVLGYSRRVESGEEPTVFSPCMNTTPAPLLLLLCEPIAPPIYALKVYPAPDDRGSNLTYLALTPDLVNRVDVSLRQTRATRVTLAARVTNDFLTYSAIGGTRDLPRSSLPPSPSRLIQLGITAPCPCFHFVSYFFFPTVFAARAPTVLEPPRRFVDSSKSSSSTDTSSTPSKSSPIPLVTVHGRGLYSARSPPKAASMTVTVVKKKD